MNQYTAKVPADYDQSQRLDKYIASVVPDMNRSKLKSGLKQILVNGKEQKVSFKVKAGDEILIQWEESIPDNIEPEDIPLDIIYEDENVCVINKPQGMVTHPAAGNWTGTLVNGLLYHWGKSAIPQDKNMAEKDLIVSRRPGIVHRLDKDTSGIIITAKNRGTEEYLARIFRNHRSMVKEYIAICSGRPQHHHGVVKTQIIRDYRDRKIFRAVTDTDEGKYAETHYKCICCYGDYSLMRIRIKTGRTHQIRVHMKYLNCPILGDPLYSKGDRKFQNATLMLNAHRLCLKLPGAREYSDFRARTPGRFMEILKVLHREYSKTILPKDR
ncbi:MAG: RluA family pseudouridine synthase [Treponema sp.]|nr:RluA family pseudouridine synthase [Treponema sp.]